MDPATVEFFIGVVGGKSVSLLLLQTEDDRTLFTTERGMAGSAYLWESTGASSEHNSTDAATVASKFDERMILEIRVDLSVFAGVSGISGSAGATIMGVSETTMAGGALC